MSFTKSVLAVFDLNYAPFPRNGEERLCSYPLTLNAFCAMGERGELRKLPLPKGIGFQPNLSLDMLPKKESSKKP